MFRCISLYPKFEPTSSFESFFPQNDDALSILYELICDWRPTTILVSWFVLLCTLYPRAHALKHHFKLRISFQLDNGLFFGAVNPDIHLVSQLPWVKLTMLHICMRQNDTMIGWISCTRTLDLLRVDQTIIDQCPCVTMNFLCLFSWLSIVGKVLPSKWQSYLLQWRPVD